MRIFNGVKCELSVIFYLSLSRLKNPAGVHRGPDPGVFADMSAKVRKIIGILESEDGMGKLGRTLGRAIVVFA